MNPAQPPDDETGSGDPPKPSASLDPFGLVAAPPAAHRGRRRAITALLLALLLLALLLRQLLVYHLDSEWGLVATHVGGLLEYFAKFDQGELWGRRPGLGGIDLRLDGSLYYWLHLPIRLFSNPFRGLLALDFVLEGATLVFWVLWGLHKRLPRSLVWLSAFFLVVVGNPNGEVLENSQTANLLCVPLVMAMIGAIVTPKARAMLLPGALLGLIFQIHQAYLMLALPLVALALFSGRPRWRRLFFLLLGAAGAYLLALPAIELPGPELLNDSTRLASAGFDPGVLTKIVARHHPAILAMLGLALVTVIRLRRGDAGPAGKVAVVWLLTGWPIMVLAVCLAADGLGNYLSPVRFGFLGPALAVLYAVVLLWVGGLCQRGLFHAGSARLGRVATPCALAMVLLLTCASVATGLASTGSPLRWALDQGFLAAWDGRRSDDDRRLGPCCHRKFRCGAPRQARSYVRLADEILQTEWGAAREPRFKFHGPADFYLDGIYMMLDASAWQFSLEAYNAGTTSDGLHRHVLALPCAMNELLPELAGQCSGDGLLFVPDVTDVPLQEDPATGLFRFTVSPAPVARRLFAVTWREQGFSDPKAFIRPKERSVRGEGATITERVRCYCGTDFTYKVVIVELKLAPGSSIRLVETVAKASAHHDPGRAGPPPLPGSPPMPPPMPSIPRPAILNERVDVVEIPLSTSRTAVRRTRGFRHSSPKVNPPVHCPSFLGGER